MIILLNGITAIRKHYIGCSIADHFKNTTPVELDGLTFHLHMDPIEVYKGTDLVYKPNTDEDGGDNGIADLINGGVEGISSEKGSELLDDAMTGYSAGGVKIHMAQSFDNVYHDTGVGNDDLNESFDYDIEWDKLIATIAPNKVNVIVGTFAPYYINKLEALYPDGFTVVNITRNPSISYLFDDSYKAGYIASLPIKTVGESLFSGIINNILVKNAIPNAINIKFEDVIAAGVISINDVDINIQEFVDYNGIITQYEKDNLDTLVDATKAGSLTEFENIVTDLTQIYPNLPGNVYTELGYELIDYKTATSALF